MIWNQGTWIQTGFTVQSVPLGKSFNILKVQFPLMRERKLKSSPCGISLRVKQNGTFKGYTRCASINKRWTSLEKEMATHSSILAWRIPRTEEPGGLQSIGSQSIEHD